jgi:hypothetical protein
MTWRTLTIAPDGTLSATPSQMDAVTGDGIAWFVENTSNVSVKVKIKDFKKKGTNTPVAAVTFCKPRCTVPSNGVPGIMLGQVTFVPAGGSGTKVLTKYTIEVRSDLFDFDYDPDLEIEKP